MRFHGRFRIDLVPAKRRDGGSEYVERDLPSIASMRSIVSRKSAYASYHSSIVNSGWCLYETLSLRKSLPISYTRSRPPTISRLR